MMSNFLSMLTINGGKGKFVGGFAGAPGMNVLILGGGIVGQGALSVLHALGANCTVMDINVGLLKTLGDYRATVAGTWLLTVDKQGHILWLGKEPS